MARGILVQHHADHRPARPLLAMRRPLDRRRHQAGAVQVNLGHAVAQLVAVPLHQLLMEVLHREVRIASPVELQHPRDLRHPGTPGGPLPQPAIRQSRRTFVAKPIAPAPK